MTVRARDLLIGVLLSLAALAGASWQVHDAAARSAERGEASLPRLICPLH